MSSKRQFPHGYYEVGYYDGLTWHKRYFRSALISWLFVQWLRLRGYQERAFEDIAE